MCRSPILPALVSVALLAACGRDAPSAPLGRCSPWVVGEATDTIRDWRVRIPAQAAAASAADPERRLEAAIGYVSGPLPEDRALIEAHGGRIAYEFRGQPTIAAAFPAPALAGYAAAADTARVVSLSLGLLHCPL
jgi:hypothetical protein